MIQALTLFAVTYVLMLVFGKYRHYIALASAAAFILTGMLPVSEILPAVDFNVLMMIAGMMGLVQLFIESSAPAYLADMVLRRVSSVQAAAVALALFAGVISAFVDNVATVLMVAPVALEICRRIKTDPVPFIIGVAVSSNLQGAATLVGDTTAIMLGSYANMSFLDFFAYKGRPGIFFAVELGALCSAVILAWLFRRERAAIPVGLPRPNVNDPVPGIMLSITIALLIIASFMPEKPDMVNGLICILMLIFGIAHAMESRKSLRAALDVLKAVDLETVGLLTGLFLMIGGVTHMGVIDAAAQLLARLGDGSAFWLYTVIVWASVLLSAFIDNLPYTATMLPVVAALAQRLNIDPALLYFGLLSGATLGGNCTPIGASANIAGIGILRRDGRAVRTRDFIRIGVPFTLAAVIPAYIYFWFIYG